MSAPGSGSNRRDFLTGRAVRAAAERAGDQLADALVDLAREFPSARETIRLHTRAMACDFNVIMNPGPADQVAHAQDALELVHRLEDQMTVYRDHSEMSRINRRAAEEPVPVEPGLFGLLLEARRICLETERAFDPTTGPLVALWRQCRSEDRLPTQEEIAAAREQTGIEHVVFDEPACTVHYTSPGVEVNLGGIGKGHALDRAAAHLAEQDLEHFVIHGGYSSVLARGVHADHSGWPVGIRNPLFPLERLAVLLLKDVALSTSGSSEQFFRHQGNRYGHILDPRTGWPAEGMLSVSVLAPNAAEADALSTAFFVLGVEKALQYCDNRADVGVLLIPAPRRGRTLEPIVRGIPADVLFFHPENHSSGT